VISLENKTDISNRTTITHTTNIPDNSVILTDEDKKILVKDLPFISLQKSCANGGFFRQASIHRSVYRGESLGNKITSEQLASIQDGSFKDIWLGDFWTFEGREGGWIIWMVVDFDYWYFIGDSKTLKHHVVVMPFEPIYNDSMNDTNTTSGGYVNSKMYTSGLQAAENEILEYFGSANVLTHREYLINAVTDGHSSGGAWYDRRVDLPNEIMIFGSHIFAPNSDGSIDISRHTTNNTQLAAFALNRQLIQASLEPGVSRNYWLRDVVNAKRFAFVSENGEASYTNASNSRGVRPVFAIG